MLEGSLAWYQGFEVMECLGANPINKAIDILLGVKNDLPLNILFVIGSDSLGDVFDTSFEEPVAKARLSSPNSLWLMLSSLSTSNQSVSHCW
jgi:hypothetical protein